MRSFFHAGSYSYLGYSDNYVENIQFEQYGNGGFVTTLPKLEAGKKYTITCVALVNKQLLSSSATSATTKLKKILSM